MGLSESSRVALARAVSLVAGGASLATIVAVWWNRDRLFVSVASGNLMSFNGTVPSSFNIDVPSVSVATTFNVTEPLASSKQETNRNMSFLPNLMEEDMPVHPWNVPTAATKATSTTATTTAMVQPSGECLIVVATPFFKRWRLPYAPENYPDNPTFCPYKLPFGGPNWPVTYTHHASCSTGLRVRLSRNLNHMHMADVVIFHARDDLSAMNRSSMKKGAVSVLFSWENQASTPVLRKESWLNKFDHLSISSPMSSVPAYGVGLPPHTGIGSPWSNIGSKLNMKLEEPIPFTQKRFIAEVSSNCEKTREAWVHAMQSALRRSGRDANAELHRLGLCGHNNNALSAIPWGTGRPSMVKVIQNYKFLVVFMGADCDYWISERLSLAFQSRVVPIYYGTGKRFLKQFVPESLLRSFVFVEDFRTGGELIEFLYKLSKNREAYEEKLKWVRGYNTSTWDIAMKYGPRNKACYWCDFCKLRPTIGSRQTMKPQGAEVECHSKMPEA